MSLEQGKCNLCDYGEFDLVKSRLRAGQDKFKVYKCKKCNHIQLLPKPTEADDKEFYSNNLQDKNCKKTIDLAKLKENHGDDTDRYVQLIKASFPHNSAILDIGVGYGFFVSELFRNGYKNVKGLEISDERRELALKHSPVPIASHDVSAGPAVIGKYDVITLFHVLEHLADPIEFLKNIKALLKPEGVLILEVPNVKELLLDNSKEYNDFYWIRAHLNYFDQETLSYALKKAGFKKIALQHVQRYGLLNLSNWLLYGKPQIEKPIFNIKGDFKEVELFYRDYLIKSKKTDSLQVMAGN